MAMSEKEIQALIKKIEAGTYTMETAEAAIAAAAKGAEVREAIYAIGYLLNIDTVGPADIKKGYDGTTYSTPGISVRTQVSDLHTALTAETTRAKSGEASALSSAKAAVKEETDRATAAEQLVAGNLSREISRAETAEAAEEARAKKAEEAETARAKAAEAAEEARAKAAEAAEKARAINREDFIENKLILETYRALAAESKETARAEAAEAAESARADAAIYAEKIRAKGAESQEEKRAKAAESAEEARALAAEAQIVRKMYDEMYSMTQWIRKVPCEYDEDTETVSVDFRHYGIIPMDSESSLAYAM